MAAGFATLFAGNDDETPITETVPEVDSHEHDLFGEPSPPEVPKGAGEPPPVWMRRLARAALYGYQTLMDDLAFWLVLGIALTAIFSAALPDGFFADGLLLGGGVLPMLLAIAIGVPLYLCASASTPIAAALIAKGLSPGAALVFLLVGPATNAATVAVVGRLLGRRLLAIYLGSIIGVSLCAGLILEALAFDAVRIATLAGIEGDDGTPLRTLKVLSAVTFVALVAASARRTRFSEGWRDLRSQWQKIVAEVRGFRWRTLSRPPVLGGAAAALIAALSTTAVLVVEPGQRGLVQRFGRTVASDLEPGLHWHWPAPIERGRAIDVDVVRQVAIGEGSMASAGVSAATEPALYITADENVIGVRAVVHYRVSDPVRFALGVEDPEPLVRSLAHRELVRLAATTPIDAFYSTARGATEEAFRSALVEGVAALPIGVAVLDARMLDVHAPSSVHDSFRDVASSLEDRVREIHGGSAEAAETIADALGAAATTLEGARAEAIRSAETARGTTASFAALSSVHARHRDVTEIRLYLETLERSLEKPRKYIQGASKNGAEVDLWIGASKLAPIDLEAPEALKRRLNLPTEEERKNP
jgi:HflK protein